MIEKINILRQWVLNSENIVFFGGAGVSTESGIPDYRSKDGLYNQKYKYPPETMLSYDFFADHTEEFYEFYKDKMINLKASPNRAHYKLAELEKMGKLKAIITQNIDGLHQMAGSKNVLELHGSVYRNYCLKCGKNKDINDIISCNKIPLCDCGGIIRPDVVLYGEGLLEATLYKAVDYIENAEVLIVGGTSLGVYPAAGMLNFYKGNKLVLINKTKTPFDNIANLVINESIGYILSEIS